MKFLKCLKPGLAAVVLATVSPAIYADNAPVDVMGTYTYYAKDSESLAVAKQKALEGARAEALKQRFGTIVQQNTMQSSSVRDGREDIHFLELSSTESMGEWISDNGTPDQKCDFDSDGKLYVVCTVKGKARAITNEASEFKATVLRNGTDLRHADNFFKSGDQMYLDFTAPSKGYVTVFLADESGQVFQMLPYPRSHIDEVKVERNKEYKFFDPASGGEFGEVQEMLLTAEDGEEFNQIYVLFSPNIFSMPAMHMNPGDVPPSMSQEEFSKWLLKVRRADSRMGVSKINVTISSDGRQTESVRL